jgi:hypothetical protein
VKIINFTIIIIGLLVVVSCNNEPKKVMPNNVKEEVNAPILKDTSIEIDKPIQNKIKIIRSCESIAKEILITSVRYKQITKGLNEAIVKNGGQSYGVSLEKSPNPTKDKAWSYSKTYEFLIYEKYRDRQLNSFRFSFNPKTKQLYEYDPISDSLKPIAFDKKLLKQYDSALKQNKKTRKL